MHTALDASFPFLLLTTTIPSATALYARHPVLFATALFATALLTRRPPPSLSTALFTQLAHHPLRSNPLRLPPSPPTAICAPTLSARSTFLRVPAAPLCLPTAVRHALHRCMLSACALRVLGGRVLFAFNAACSSKESRALYLHTCTHFIPSHLPPLLINGAYSSISASMSPANPTHSHLCLSKALSPEVCLLHCLLSCLRY